MEKRNVVLEKSFEFALSIIEFSEQLEIKKKYVLARQILRSGTSIGANISEAQSCESKADFIHKLKIAAKEAEETKYW
jgi:four helix bundle protein